MLGPSRAGPQKSKISEEYDFIAGLALGLAIGSSSQVEKHRRRPPDTRRSADIRGLEELCLYIYQVFACRSNLITFSRPSYCPLCTSSLSPCRSVWKDTTSVAFSLRQSSMAAEAGEVVHLPVIDISNPTLEVGKKLIAAAAKYGFLYIDTNGTGFTEDIVDREFAIGRKFFSQPDSVKATSTIDETNRGWTGMHTEVLDPKNQRKGDFKEALNIGEFTSGRPGPNFPEVLSLHIEELAEFESISKSVRDRILDLLAMGLGIEDEKFFSARHTSPSGCTMRLLHYPSLSDDDDYQPDIDIRAGAHSDYGSITLLFQRPSQPGLEILTPDNTWAPVPVVPSGYKTSTTLPPILVNIADLLSYWTNGLLKSTVHRVIFPKEARRGGEDRYSIAYFCHPANDTELVPVPSKMVQERKFSGQVGHGGGVDDTKAMTAAEHLHKRLEATYGFRMDKASVREQVATS